MGKYSKNIFNLVLCLTFTRNNKFTIHYLNKTGPEQKNRHLQAKKSLHHLHHKILKQKTFTFSPTFEPDITCESDENSRKTEKKFNILLN